MINKKNTPSEWDHEDLINQINKVNTPDGLEMTSSSEADINLEYGPVPPNYMKTKATQLFDGKTIGSVIEREFDVKKTNNDLANLIDITLNLSESAGTFYNLDELAYDIAVYVKSGKLVKDACDDFSKEVKPIVHTIDDELGPYATVNCSFPTRGGVPYVSIIVRDTRVIINGGGQVAEPIKLSGKEFLKLSVELKKIGSKYSKRTKNLDIKISRDTVTRNNNQDLKDTDRLYI